MEADMKMQAVMVELRSLSNIIMRYMEKYSNKKKVDAITGTNGWIIAFLSQNPDRDIFQRDLEKEFSITRSTASKVVNLMVQKGLIERRPVAGDARLKKLVLTEKAMGLSHLMMDDCVRAENRLTEGFTEEELAQLFSYLARMKENMSSMLE